MKAPRCISFVTHPSRSSTMSASRTGIRLTPRSWAIASCGTRMPGRSSPSKIRLRTCDAMCSPLGVRTQLRLATSVRAAFGCSARTRSGRWHAYILCESAHQSADLNVCLRSVVPGRTPTESWPSSPSQRHDKIYNLTRTRSRWLVYEDRRTGHNRWALSRTRTGDGEPVPGDP